MAEANESVFSRLSKASSALNEQADKASEYISGVNERLSEIGVGIEVWDATPITSDPTIYVKKGLFRDEEYPDGITVPEEIPSQEFVYLGHKKWGPKWQLCLKTTVEYQDEEGEWEVVASSARALAEAPRDLRILSVPRIPAFLEHLADRVEKAAQSLVDTIKTEEDTKTAPETLQATEVTKSRSNRKPVTIVAREVK